MAEITAAMVKELREKSGAGMMDCKAALVEAGGNFEEAIKILRKKGLAAASKKAGRVTSEGVIHALVRGNTGVLLELNSETDFVAQNAEFQGLAQKLAELLLSSKTSEVEPFLKDPWPGDPEGRDIGGVIAGKIATIKENIALRRFVRYQADPNGTVGAYVHANKKIGVLVELEGAGDASKLEPLAREVAMHIAAAEPRFLRREDVTEKDVNTEREIARDQALKSGKPENVIEKIIAGKMEKFYGETVLLEQPYIRDDKLTVRQLLVQRGKDSGAGFTVKRFIRYRLGEGLQKREDDFAAEVRAQAGR
jgi:elongation factor Ts